MHTYESVYVCMCLCAHRCQKTVLLELESWEAVCCLAWVVITELQFSRKTKSPLSYLPISPFPMFL